MKMARITLPDGTEYVGRVTAGNKDRASEIITLTFRIEIEETEPEMDDQTYRGQILTLASAFLQWNGQEASTAPTPEQVFAMADDLYAWATVDNRMDRLAVAQNMLNLLQWNGQPDSTVPTPEQGFALLDRIWQWIYREQLNEMQLRKGLFAQALNNLQWRAQITGSLPTPDQVFALADQMSQWVENIE